MYYSHVSSELDTKVWLDCYTYISSHSALKITRKKQSLGLMMMADAMLNFVITISAWSCHRGRCGGKTVYFCIIYGIVVMMSSAMLGSLLGYVVMCVLCKYAEHARAWVSFSLIRKFGVWISGPPFNWYASQFANPRKNSRPTRPDSRNCNCTQYIFF